MTTTQRAWRNLYRANTAANGEQKAIVAGSPVAAIVSELTQDEILAAGGTAENGGFNVQIESTLLTAPPEKFQPIQVLGPSLVQFDGLKILNVNLNNGIYLVTAADFVASET